MLLLARLYICKEIILVYFHSALSNLKEIPHQIPLKMLYNYTIKCVSHLEEYAYLIFTEHHDIEL